MTVRSREEGGDKTASCSEAGAREDDEGGEVEGRGMAREEGILVEIVSWFNSLGT